MMWQELLVVIACSQPQGGCSQAQSAYYSTHPAFKQLIKKEGNKAKEVLGPEVVFLTPVYILQASGKATFHIGKYLSLQISNKSEKSLLFNFSF